MYGRMAMKGVAMYALRSSSLSSVEVKARDGEWLWSNMGMTQRKQRHNTSFHSGNQKEKEHNIQHLTICGSTIVIFVFASYTPSGSKIETNKKENLNLCFEAEKVTR